MSVLVKGMKMPANGEALVIFSDGNAELYDKIDVEILDFPKKNRKAIPVPDHGRLIDADALIEILSKVIDINASIEQRNEATDQERRCLWWFEQQIEIAPTIIPASRKESQ